MTLVLAWVCLPEHLPDALLGVEVPSLPVFELVCVLIEQVFEPVYELIFVQNEMQIVSLFFSAEGEISSALPIVSGPFSSFPSFSFFTSGQ